ncbi:MAG: SDR family oxidoreductase [Bacilli bacterium]|nr:SDR family oxidoreductase [Bacilli bacterium]
MLPVFFGEKTIIMFGTSARPFILQRKIARTSALAVSLGPKIRVNAIAPGWIDTADATYEGSDANQQLVGRVGVRDDIANMVLYLCSEKASFITCQEIVIDGGMSKLMIYHGEHGWKKE